ncbi:MAG: dienelactone hydrolase family protein [Victivallaceae bacterium]|nr:dienelactone hydrolase family protein [Victivallaceae bacterium]
MKRKIIAMAAGMLLAGNICHGGDMDKNAWTHWTDEELFAVPERKSDAGYEEFRTQGLESFLLEGLPTADGKKTYAYAYYGRPEGTPPAGGWPGVVLFHGGGGTAFKDYVRMWNKRGYAAITVDHYGQLPDEKTPRPQRAMLPISWQGMSPKPFGEGDKEMRCMWVRNAVALIVRAHTDLLSRPEVNKSNTGLLGISWGSVMGSIVATRDKRFAYAALCYGCGNYDLSEDKNNTFFKYRNDPWEPKHHVGNLAVPTYWLAGTNDDAFELPGWQKTVDSAPGTVGDSKVVKLDHDHTGWAYEMVWRFADYKSSGKDTRPPRLGATEIKDGMVTAKIVFPGDGIKKAELCYTTAQKSGLKIKWETIPAEIAGDEIQAALPQDAKAVFINAYDRDWEGPWQWPASSPYTKIK